MSLILQRLGELLKMEELQELVPSFQRKKNSKYQDPVMFCQSLIFRNVLSISSLIFLNRLKYVHFSVIGESLGDFCTGKLDILKN